MENMKFITKNKAICGFICFIVVLGGAILWRDRIMGFASGDACRTSGGIWIYEEYGNLCTPDSDSYKKTRLDRLNAESDAYTYYLSQQCGALPAVKKNKKICECPDGKYFGSYEEGCIPESERAKPSDEAQKEVDKKINESENNAWKNNEGIDNALGR